MRGRLLAVVGIIYLLLAASFLFTPTPASATVRVPAEWEPQEAVWMQWPKGIESSYRPNFADIIDALQEYQSIHILVASAYARNQAQNYLTNAGVPLTNITWHIMSYDWAWMRDNGPVWVEVDGEVEVTDWGFNGWGGEVSYWDQDDDVPCQVAAAESVPCQTWSYINERGTLEFNGTNTLITSWTVLEHRNPGVPQSQLEDSLEAAFGVSQVVWLVGSSPGDLTRGHTDGIARFIDANTVAVGRYIDQGDPDAQLYEDAATTIQSAGFDVVRVDFPGNFTYRGEVMAANYMNWLVTDGLVIVCGFDTPAWDNAAADTIQSFFPDRDVIVVDVRELWYWGGGVHCVTNDQPVGGTIVGVNGPAESPMPRVRLQNHPNPFNPATTIRFQTVQSGPASLVIYDLSGRVVRQLVDGPLSAGLHTDVWDGTDDAGRPVSSGPYFYQLRSPTARETRKMILLK